MHATIRKTTYRGHEIVLTTYRPNGCDQTQEYHTATDDMSGAMLADSDEDLDALKVYANPDKAIQDAKDGIEAVLDTAGPDEINETFSDALAGGTTRARRSLRDAIRSFTDTRDDNGQPIAPSEATKAAAYDALINALDQVVTHDSRWDSTR